MRIEIEIANVEIGAEALQFIHTTLAFSTWRHEPGVSRLRVGLEAWVEGDLRGVACRLSALRADGSCVSVDRHGADLFEAVNEAAHRLELGLHRAVVDRRLEATPSIAA